MLIGAHVSVADGYARAVEYAKSVGCECIQVFAKSPRQWRGPATDPEAAAHFRELRERAGLGPLYTHSAYLLNLATDDDVLWVRSIDALVDELDRASLLGASGLVTHVGSSRRSDAGFAADRIAEAVTRAFERFESARVSAVRLLLENTAGQGNSFGSTFEQLADVSRRTNLPSSLLGVCLDTCHAHAFGLCLDTRDGWRRVLDSMGRSTGADRLGLIHANDCMFAAGSRRDRHAWIGDGTIGYAGFAAMFETLNETECPADLCAITEIPGEKPYKDAENLRRLRALAAAHTPFIEEGNGNGASVSGYE